MDPSWWLLFVLLGYTCSVTWCAITLPVPTYPVPPCESQIFCYGPLLDTVQKSKIFNNDKDFLRMKLKYPPETIVGQFLSLVKTSNGTSNITRVVVQDFLDKHFEHIPIDDELEYWSPPDWKADLPFITKIKDENYRQWAKRLHYQWLELSRKVSTKIKRNPNSYSIIYMKNGFILPNPRATEMLYFDSYFVVRALLISGMKDTAKGIIENLIELADRYHKVPYGNRHYYTGYSYGPPMLIAMVKEYLRHSNYTDFVISSLKQLEIENEYWRRRVVRANRAGKMLSLSVYQVQPSVPRPFEYSHDTDLSRQIYENFLTKFYTNLGSMTESGWDKSSRWLTQTAGPNFSIRSVRTIDMAPVDLNAILCMNERILASFYRLAGHEGVSGQHTRRCIEIKDAIHELLWDNEKGSWFDMDSKDETRNRRWFASNVIPLFSQCYGNGVGGVSNGTIENRVLSYLKKSVPNKFAGGVPLSRLTTGFDWDEPYTSAPYMLMIIEGLASSDQGMARIMARELAQRWVLANYKLYRQTGKTFKKSDTFNVNTYDKKIYPPDQETYAWTNAVILILLEKYGDVMVSETSFFSKIAPKTSVANHIYSTNLFILTTLPTAFLLTISNLRNIS